MSYSILLILHDDEHQSDYNNVISQSKYELGVVVFRLNILLVVKLSMNA